MAEKKIRVLIADDEPDIVAILKRRLVAEGFDVITAADGREAWDAIVKRLPDVIVLDINMPEMDGLAILRAMRASPPTSKWQAVIIVSARNQLEHMREGVDLQADHYLTKPCSAEDVVSAVRLVSTTKPLKVQW